MTSICSAFELLHYAFGRHRWWPGDLLVGTYMLRILARHDWIGYDANYHEIKDYFESALPADARLYNEYR
jgi:endonuclease III-like uncharacterized protein